jgi:hypothetical protein
VFELAEKNKLSMILALTGTVLVWFPIAFTLLASFTGFIRSGQAHLDYLMPAEMFPVALIGALLLLWAAIRSKIYKRMAGTGLGLFVAFPVLGSVVAVASGLASGRTEMGGIEWAFVLLFIALFAGAQILLGITGILLIKKLIVKPTAAGQ